MYVHVKATSKQAISEMRVRGPWVVLTQEKAHLPDLKQRACVTGWPVPQDSGRVQLDLLPGVAL